MSRLRRGILQAQKPDAAPSNACPAAGELLSPAPRRRGAAARVQSRSRNARHLFPLPVSGTDLRCARCARRGGYLRFREPVGGTAVRGDGSDAHGTPCVLTRVKGHEDLLEGSGAGYLVPFGDAAAFAEAVQTLGRNAALRARMGAAANYCVIILF